MRVLITGMSGTGKSSVVGALRDRGYTAYDADDDGFTVAGEAGEWHWRVDAVAELLAGVGDDLVFFAGCSDEQRDFAWDAIVLLTVPEDVMVERLRARTSNSYGKTDAELARALADRHEVEPLLRRVAGTVIDASAPLPEVTDAVVRAVSVS